MLVLYYLWKKFSKFSHLEKKVFYAFSFQLCSTANPKFSFVSLCEINCIKIQTMSLVSKSIYFSRDSLCFIYFDVIIRQRLKKSSSWLNFFVSCVNEIKTCSLVQQLILGMLRDLILQSHTFNRLMEIRFYIFVSF